MNPKEIAEHIDNEKHLSIEELEELVRLLEEQIISAREYQKWLQAGTHHETRFLQD